MISRVLSDMIDDESFVMHGRIPEGFDVGHRRIVGSIRNPWDWYVSLWAYGCSHRGYMHQHVTKRLRGFARFRLPPHTIYRYLINALNKPLKDYRDAYSDVNSPEHFRKWLRMLSDHDRRYDLRERYGDSPVSSIAGFMTYRYIYRYSDDIKPLYIKGNLKHFDDLVRYDQEHNMLDGVIRNESLFTDLIDQLEKSGIALKPDEKSRIIQLDRVNTSKRERNLDFYYNQETKDLVSRRERFIIEKYGYSFP